MLIPAGQRNSADDSGKLVDVVEEGRRKGVEVDEVTNIYGAHKALTGNELPRPRTAASVKPRRRRDRALKAKAETWLEQYDNAVSSYHRLDISKLPPAVALMSWARLQPPQRNTPRAPGLGAQQATRLPPGGGLS